MILGKTLQRSLNLNNKKFWGAFCGLILAFLLIFGALSVPLAEAKGKFENEYAEFKWETSLSKEQVGKGEGFYSLIDLALTIKKIPEKYKDLVESLSLSGIRIITAISYKVMGRDTESGKYLVLYSGEISKKVPVSKLKKGETLKFHEKIPPSEDIIFPQKAKYGDYILFIKLTRAEVRFLSFSEDFSHLIPSKASEPGMEIGTVNYKKTAEEIIKPIGDANYDWVVDKQDLEVVANSFNTKPPANPDADFNGDGIVDILDLVKVGLHYGEGLY